MLTPLSQQSRGTDEDVDPFHDPLASPLLSTGRGAFGGAPPTNLWRHSPEEVSRPRPHAPNGNGRSSPSRPLNAEIAELRAKVEMQEEMLRRILDAVGGIGSGSEVGLGPALQKRGGSRSQTRDGSRTS